MKRFSDFAKPPLDGPKFAIDELINKEVVIKDYKISGSKYNGKLLTIQFELEGTTHVVLTGSGVLLNQCEEYKDKMPFISTIKKIAKYYTFS
jgi:hypothetical protein